MELDRPFYEEDGRLIDFISQNQNIETKKSPTFASILSIFPGAGRAYAGRKLDGIMGLWTVYLCLLYTSPSPRDKRQYRMPSSA